MGTPRAEDKDDKRKCSQCGEWKPLNLEHFIPSSSCRYGIAGTCRVCRRKYAKRDKDKNREARSKRRRELYATSERAIEKRRERERWLKSPERKRAQVLRSGIRERANKLGIPWDSDYFTVKMLAKSLSEDPFCECCGRKLDVGRKHDGRKNDASPSLDRVIPELGYVRGNTAMLCWRCNNLKRDADAKELETIVNWLRSWGAETGKLG